MFTFWCRWCRHAAGVWICLCVATEKLVMISHHHQLFCRGLYFILPTFCETDPIPIAQQSRHLSHFKINYVSTDVTISTAVPSLNINFQLRSSMNSHVDSPSSSPHDSAVTFLDLLHISCLYLTEPRDIWELPVHMPAYLTAKHTQTDYLNQHKIEERDSACCF